MNGLKEPKSFSRLSNFSHIYIEDEAADYPLTQEILARFPKAATVKIGRYQEILNRTQQNWRESKEFQKLILAVKKDGFLYEASNIVQKSETERFFYTTPILNCIYDCDYCFLQGKYNSPHAVIFVNLNDFFNAAQSELERGDFCIAPSYETDLLGFENIVPLTRRWIKFADQNPKLTLEIRTKSAYYRSISDIEPPPNVILSWTVSPEEVASRYEKGTPAVSKRLMAAKSALNEGWKVRLCFDPILAVKNWQTIYSEFFKKLSSEFPLSKLLDVSVGTFRMSHDFLKNIQHSRDDSDILFYPFESKDGVASYPQKVNEEALSLARDTLLKSLQSEQIRVWS